MSSIPVKINNTTILTFDITNQEVILNYLNSLKASEVNSLSTATLCTTSQCYNCNQVYCTEVHCNQILCSDKQCNQIHCNQIKCTQCSGECVNCTYDTDCCECNDSE